MHLLVSFFTKWFVFNPFFFFFRYHHHHHHHVAPAFPLVLPFKKKQCIFSRFLSHQNVFKMYPRFPLLKSITINLRICNVIIIIIIKSRHQHGSSWPSLASLLYRPSHPVNLQGYILYRHKAVVCRFYLVVLPLLVHVKTGVCPLWVRPYFSSSVLRVCFILESFRDGWWVAVQLLRICQCLPPDRAWHKVNDLKAVQLLLCRELFDISCCILV